MTTMYVTYSGDAQTPFNREHWLKVHFPLVMECWGPYGLERLEGFFPQGGDGGEGVIALCICHFRDKDALEAALASPQTQQVMADVDLVTAVKPKRSLAVPL